jgi:YD repeat-containing protein
LAFDGIGHLVREQDARGYITVYEYDSESPNLLVSKDSGYHVESCDPATDESWCRVESTDELLTTSLVGDPSELDSVTFQYNDPNWPTRVTHECRASVVEDGQTVCTVRSYDPITGTVTSTVQEGWTVDANSQTVLEAHTMTRSYYESGDPPIFNPADEAATAGVILTHQTAWASWMSLSQPSGQIKETLGPRYHDVNDGADDRTWYVYYPADSSVPTELRGRVAAIKSPDGEVTFYDDYSLSGITRTIDSRGVATSFTYDSLGRRTGVTVEGEVGCDTAADPLCATDLMSQMVYEDGHLHMTISPLGHRDVVAMRDEWGRALVRERYSSDDPSNAKERLELTLDPDTGLNARDK